MLHGPCSRPFNFHCVRWWKEQRCWKATSQDGQERTQVGIRETGPPSSSGEATQPSLADAGRQLRTWRVQHSSWDWVFLPLTQQEFLDSLPLLTARFCLGVCYSCLSLEFPCPLARRADTLHILCLFFMLIWVFPGPFSPSYVMCRSIFSASDSETVGLLGTKTFCVPPSLDCRR